MCIRNKPKTPTDYEAVYELPGIFSLPTYLSDVELKFANVGKTEISRPKRKIVFGPWELDKVRFEFN